jgi:hypothetical protein
MESNSEISSYGSITDGLWNFYKQIAQIVKKSKGTKVIVDTSRCFTRKNVGNRRLPY